MELPPSSMNEENQPWGIEERKRKRNRYRVVAMETLWAGPRRATFAPRVTRRRSLEPEVRGSGGVGGCAGAMEVTEPGLSMGARRLPAPCSHLAGWNAGLDPSASSLSRRCPVSPSSHRPTTTDLCSLMSFPSSQVAAPPA